MRRFQKTCHWVGGFVTGSATQDCRDGSAKRDIGWSTEDTRYCMDTLLHAFSSAQSNRFLAAFAMVHAAIWAYGFLNYYRKVLASDRYLEMHTDGF